MTEPSDTSRAFVRRLFGRNDEPEPAASASGAMAPGPIVPAEGKTTPPPASAPDDKFSEFVHELFADPDDD